MNHALYMKLIPGFDDGLENNFNHLLFADDLIIITRANRSAVKFCKLCLNIYTDPTGQASNLSKSSIHVPSWCNRRLLSSSRSILGMNVGRFPFKYLGAFISLKRLTIRQFHFLEDI